MDVHFWIITFCASFTLIQMQTCREPKCKTSRIHGMKGADCYNKDIRTFSLCVSNDIEILDLSRNRIRKITKDDLKKFSYLKMLYLADNLIVTIDEASFEEKDYLHTLDLSINGLTKVPAVLFHLPSLQSLYLGQNLNMNIVDTVERAKPLTSPLFHLDISYVMSEEPNELPEMGLMPSLVKYNISGNKLISTTTKHFAGLCSLKLLDTTNVSAKFEKPCDCWTINRWLRSRKVAFKPFECTISDAECLDEVPPIDLETHAKCKKKIEDIYQKSKTKTILLIVVPIVSVILIGVACFIARKRYKQKSKIPELTEELMVFNNALLTKT